LKGKVVLITNVACLCGYTSSNYEQLVLLHKKYGRDLEILAFPSNEFGNQELKTSEEIRNFVDNLGVQFQMVRGVLT
jgi:glutathione peroxidase